MGLALNLLLTLLIELPIIALFFRRKKRQAVILMSALINIISWAVAHIIIFSTDINIYYIAIVIAIGEAIAFQKFLPCIWKKAIIISVIVNSLSFFITKQIPSNIELFQTKPEMYNGMHSNNFKTPGNYILPTITFI